MKVIVDVFAAIGFAVVAGLTFVAVEDRIIMRRHRKRIDAALKKAPSITLGGITFVRAEPDDKP